MIFYFNDNENCILKGIEEKENKEKNKKVDIFF